MWDLPGSLRIDLRSGIRERALFVPHRKTGEQMFVCLDDPPSEPVGGVLVCSSILADLLSNYQREVHLARHLAATGFSVVRFHHLGTGNSDGDPADVTLQSLQAEAGWVGERLWSRLGQRPFALVGTRWGALSAAAVAADHPGVPLVLWEPVLDFDRYFREAMRSRAMSAIATRKVQSGRGERLSDLLEEQGYADIVGNIVHPALYHSAVGRDPLAMFNGARRSALIVQFGGRQLRREYCLFQEGLQAKGWTVDTRVIDLAESWWFRTGPRILLHQELNESTGAWLQARFVDSSGSQ